MNNNSLNKKLKILINYFNRGNYDFVIDQSKNLIKKFPQIIFIHNLLGSSYQNKGCYNEAVDVFIKALKINPFDSAIKNNLATSYKYLLQYDESEKIYNEIIKRNPKYVNAYINLANLKRDMNKLDEAIIFYKKADELSPKNYVIFYLLALTYQGLGDFKQCLRYARECLIIKPEFVKADHLISQSKKYTKDDNDIETLKKKLDNIEINNFDKIDLYFALSKAYEDQNNFDEAYKFLKIGNDLYKKKTKYNVDYDLRLNQNVIDLFKDIKFKQFLNNRKKYKIIFILGMPRSGTSLLEQIISSHDEVVGGGELPKISNLINKFFMKNKILSGENFKKIIQNPINIDNIAKEYVQFINYFDIKDKYIVDKAPLNFRWIGFIRIFFPNAIIIHSYRNPKDNCLSMYKNLFENSLEFTYDEGDLVKFYKSYIELLNFWKKKEDNNIINVNYENLIKNSEIEIKNIIKKSGLVWDKKCLQFQKNTNPIKTMSTAQARQPIYKSSLNSFDRYKKFLKIIDREL